MELVKPPQRVSRSAVIEENMRVIVDKAAQSEDFSLRAFVNVVRPPALALYFLTAKQEPNQATIKETLDAYRSSSA
ncbi:MAG: hypothetical protein ACOH2J_06980 [Allorhizobium sp.]